MARGRAHARLLVQLSVRGRGEVGGGQLIRKKLGEKNECQAEPTTTHKPTFDYHSRHAHRRISCPHAQPLVYADVDNSNKNGVGNSGNCPQQQ